MIFLHFKSTGYIHCPTNTTEMTNIFKSASKNLKDTNEKHFIYLDGDFPENETNILNENQFADLTFDKFRGDGVS